MFSFLRALPQSMTIKLAALVAVLATAAGLATASNPGVAPVLVPYTITAIAGNNQTSIGGYGGDGGPALSATLNGPSSIAVDSVGNVYISDQSNALIRELNVQTGVLKIIAGVPPTKCTGTVCTTINPGCSDGVPAVGNPTGSRTQGLVVDGFGNVYMADYNYQGAWVIYRGGAQVASFITLVDPTGVATAGGVKPGYVYHIAGTAAPKAGGGCTSTSGSVDKVLATSAVFHDPLQMGIDPAGNLYIQDYANSVVRVINTQATTQTFFGVSVKPGFVAAIVGCNATLTTVCPGTVPAFGGPAGGALFSNQLAGMTTDQYGNIYELDTKGATGSIYAGVAYAGGAALAHLINIQSGLTATPGGWYEAINSITNTTALPTSTPQAVLSNNQDYIVIRPASITVDANGNLYMLDTHWTAIFRVDANSQMVTRFNIGLGTGTPAGTNTAPTYCSGTSGPQSTDAYGDGCPVSVAKWGSGGTGYVTFDGAGNLYASDTGNNIVRKISLGNAFPATSAGATTTQTMQVHFDGSNLPAATNPFTIAPGSVEFAINGTPTCSNYTLGLDTSIECYVTVAFKPSLTGPRSAVLKVTTANGSVYPFALSGYGNGGQIAVDGGIPSTVSATGLGSTSAVATDTFGNVYIADANNNRVVVVPAGGGAQTTVGTGLSNPLGVAVDAQGNVYISDAGNSRVVEVSATTGAQTVLTTNVNNPHGIGVDGKGNVYVADTGNSRVVEISPFGELAPVPLLAYSGAQAFVTPVGIAIDKNNNVYVADAGNSNGIIEITAGGGDLQTPPGSTSLASPTTIVGFGTAFITAPTGVAIDAAGDLYVSDGASNLVEEFPAATGPGSEPVVLNLPGLNAPAGLALDSVGNLYVADSANSRVLLDNRAQISVNFGTVSQFQTPPTAALTVTNIGTTALTPASPFEVLTGATADFSSKDTCGASNFPLGTLASGLHCSLTPSFLPVVNGPLNASIGVQGGAANISLSGNGQNPLAALSLAVTSPATGPVYGSPAVVTLVATQPHGSSAPTGTITFNYTINGVAQTPVTVNLASSGSGATSAALTLNNLLAARVYVINATYSGDANNSQTAATPLTFTVPGLPLTVVANSVSFTYGNPVPALTGTVTGILPADQAGITVTFTSAATSSTPITTATNKYPITVTLSGGNYQNYTIPNAVTPSGAPAYVTENAAPMTVVVNSISTTYGYANVSFTSSVTGAVNGDVPSIKYTPAQSQVLGAGTYTIVPTLSILTKGSSYDKINNYNLTVTNGTLTVGQANSLINVSQPVKAVLPTNLPTAALTFTAVPSIFGNYGTPTGTITLTDTFTPITATGPGTTVSQPAVTLPLVSGSVTYTPTNTTLGTHVYTLAYGGDANFIASNTSATPNTLIVDVADFVVTSTTSPIQVAPGVIPGGLATAQGEQVATPEQAPVQITPILGSTQVVNLTCAVPASYITCTLSPATVTMSGTTVQTSTISVSTPATLPLTGKLDMGHAARDVEYAAIPFALLTMIPLFLKRRRVLISRLLVALLSVALLVGASGCGGNLVQFFNPVPAGAQQVVITGTSGAISRSFTVTVEIQ